jgi:lauroyl/myristoyl acyltransferase
MPLAHRALLPAVAGLTAACAALAFFFAVLGRIRKAIASNLDPVLGRAGPFTQWRRAGRTMYAFAGCFADRYRSMSDPGRYRAVLEGEDNWRAAMATGSGVVLTTAHIGPWENAAHFVASDVKRRVHVVREKEMDPRAQEFLESILARTGGDVVTHFAEDDPALALELVRALNQGDIVALQGDRPRAGGRSVDVGLFGRSFSLPIGPAALARAVGVPILPVFNFREGRFFLRSVVRPAIHVDHSTDRDLDLERALRRLGAEIEWAIRERPFQWFCFKRLWN